MNNMFDDIDPWERLLLLQQRVEMLERIQEELIRSVTIQQEHMKNVNLAVMSLQKLYMENQQ
jgi:hypothetical protein